MGNLGVSVEPTTALLLIVGFLPIFPTYKTSDPFFPSCFPIRWAQTLITSSRCFFNRPRVLTMMSASNCDQGLKLRTGKLTLTGVLYTDQNIMIRKRVCNDMTNN